MYALEASPRPQPLAPIAKYGSVKEALRDGVRDYNAGDKAGAAQALEYAATRGHTLALWKLGRMYADGDGVDHDDLKAFEYFSKLADANADESPDSPNAPVVASAFVALGGYFLDGIKGTYVTANPSRAREMFQYAASYFSDPHAQYNLARLYLDGTGVQKDPRQAARWFKLCRRERPCGVPGSPWAAPYQRRWRAAPKRARPDVADARARGGGRIEGAVDLRTLREGVLRRERQRPETRPCSARAIHPSAPVSRRHCAYFVPGRSRSSLSDKW